MIQILITLKLIIQNLRWDTMKEWTIPQEHLHQTNIIAKPKKYFLISTFLSQIRTQNSFTIANRPLPYG
jgi:hypothetical protein